MGSSSTSPVRLENGSDLDRFLAETDAALVEFYTKGCPKCQAMEPVLGNVARATGIDVGLLNPGADLGLVDRFEIQSVPTLVLFENGDAIARLADGFVGTAAVVEFVSKHVPHVVQQN